MYVANISLSHTTPAAAWFKAECDGLFVVAREPEAAMAAKLIDEGRWPNSDYSTIFNGTPSLKFRSLGHAAMPIFKARAAFAAMNQAE